MSDDSGPGTGRRPAASGRRVVLISGASSGLGQVGAEFLARAGHTVIGTSRRQLPDTATGVLMRALDVTDPQSVRSCVKQVLAEFGRIDVLVNNAGVLHIGPAEETPPEITATILETNLFGTMRLTNAVLPGMRARRDGRVINVASLAGVVPPPGSSSYAASKGAIVAYSASLRVELVEFGIRVTVIEPGFFRTQLFEVPGPPPVTFADYDRNRDAVREANRTALRTGTDPRRFGRLLVRVTEARRPAARYRIGPDANWVPRAQGLVPTPLFDRVVRRRFGMS